MKFKHAKWPLLILLTVGSVACDEKNGGTGTIDVADAPATEETTTGNVTPTFPSFGNNNAKSVPEPSSILALSAFAGLAWFTTKRRGA